MRSKPGSGEAVDVLHGEILRAGANRAQLRDILARHDPEDSVLISLLRRALPVLFLEEVASTPPWSERAAILGKVVLNPKTPRVLSLRLLPSIGWRDLADVASSPQVPGGVRVRSEALLLEMLPDLRLGDRITLAKLAPSPVLRVLLADPEPKVAGAALINPRLREEDLLLALRQPTASHALIGAAASSSRWSEAYGVRLTLVLQSRTPLSVALLQLSSLLKKDLLRVAETPGLAPLVQAAARRVAENPTPSGGGRTLKGSAT